MDCKEYGACLYLGEDDEDVCPQCQIDALKKHLIEAQERHRYELARADVLDRENNEAQAEIARLKGGGE